MTGDVNLTSTAGAIRFSLSRQEGEVRRVTLDEDVALAIADLIERWPAAEAVIPVPTKAPKMPDGRDLPVMSKEEVDAFFGAILGGLRKERLRRENVLWQARRLESSLAQLAAAEAVIQAARVAVQEQDANNPFVGYSWETLRDALAALGDGQ